MAEQWLSIVEYARTFNLSDMTVRRRIKTGKLHAVLKDGKYYIPTQNADAKKVAQTPTDADDFAHQGKYRYESAPAPRAPSQEMHVIKAHPAAQRTIVAPQEPMRMHQSVIPTPAVLPVPEKNDVRYAAIPASLAAPLVTQDRSLIDTRALLAYCEATLKKMNELERRTVERFKAKLESVEATLQLRENEVRSLKQQVEDLQVLVGILEKKNAR
jgi:hypothetical protein